MKWFEFVILVGTLALFAFGMYSMFGDSILLNGINEKKKTTTQKEVAKNIPTAPKRYDLRWTKTAIAPWEARDSGEVFLFQNKIWINGRHQWQQNSQGKQND